MVICAAETLVRSHSPASAALANRRYSKLEDRLLAEEVVDAQDLALAQQPVQPGVQFPGRGSAPGAGGTHHGPFGPKKETRYGPQLERRSSKKPKTFSQPS